MLTRIQEIRLALKRHKPLSEMEDQNLGEAWLIQVEDKIYIKLKDRTTDSYYKTIRINKKAEKAGADH
jgi:hypothetical protein